MFTPPSGVEGHMGWLSYEWGDVLTVLQSVAAGVFCPEFVLKGAGRMDRWMS